MLKLIILNSNLEEIKNLCNCIFNEISDVQLSGICTNFEEFDYLIKHINPDIIAMDYFDFIHSKYRKRSEFRKSKIIFSNLKHQLNNTENQLYVYNYFSQSKMIRLISEFVSKQTHKSVRQKVYKLLETFHFDFKLLGTTYLYESILYCYENKTDYVFENLEKNVYPYIAEKYHSTTSNVKRAIVRSFDVMNANISMSAQKQVSDILKVDISEKTTAKQLIGTIVVKLN